MNNEFFAAFQPIVNVASGQIIGYEALARRRGENGQIVSAENMIVETEHSLSDRQLIDQQVRNDALARFASNAPVSTFLSLNVLPELLGSAEQAIQDLVASVQNLAIDPDRITIEINNLKTESKVLGELIHGYHEAGFRIAFTDINASLLEFDCLLELKPDIIKIDLKAFGESDLQPRQQALLQMVGDLGGRLGCKIICERVENEHALFFALHCNARSIQGHFLAEADTDFASVDSLHEPMQQVLAHHFDFAMEQSTRRQWQAERIYSELLALRELLLSVGLGDNLQTYQPDPAILRFFICNRQGEQISANWSYQENHWKRDDSVVGYNWSWRPYFYQLVVSIDYERRILTSSDYIDIETGLPCYTLALALDEQRVLLVDISNETKSSSGRLPANIGFRSDVMPPMNG